MTGECAACGPVRLASKPNGVGRRRVLVCAIGRNNSRHSGRRANPGRSGKP